MKLKQSNPHLKKKSAAARNSALRVSAETSSAVEGIRAPFAKGKEQSEPKTTAAFIALTKWVDEDQFGMHFCRGAGDC